MKSFPAARSSRETTHFFISPPRRRARAWCLCRVCPAGHCCVIKLVVDWSKSDWSDWVGFFGFVCQLVWQGASPKRNELIEVVAAKVGAVQVFLHGVEGTFPIHDVFQLLHVGLRNRPSDWSTLYN